MSVRRLAKEQPASFAFSKDTQAKAEWWATGTRVWWLDKAVIMKPPFR